MDPVGVCPCVAGLNALVPRVAELRVTSTAAVSEPRTAATTTTCFPRFLDGAAFEAHGPDGRRCCGCRCVYVSIGQRNDKTVSSYRLVIELHVISLALTFAGLHAFRPPVSNVFAAKSSAVLEPSTARSATTDSA